MLKNVILAKQHNKKQKKKNQFALNGVFLYQFVGNYTL